MLLWTLFFPCWLPALREEASETGACFCLLSQMPLMASFSNRQVQRHPPVRNSICQILISSIYPHRSQRWSRIRSPLGHPPRRRLHQRRPRPRRGKRKITVQRTEQNNPLGLEVQLHITEVVCPALSEPGLRAFLPFMTGVSVCLNRGDIDPKAQQLAEAAGSSLVSIIVDHIFLYIKDTEFQLELLMRSLFFSRASISDGECSKNLSCIKVGGMFLRYYICPCYSRLHKS
ncbi:uncharacterized protein [Zea mays]|uniref:uncharacterized protein isoform X1 n=1 Tax=Zea mays TaxID=4577 RepID=UPI0009AA3FAB|nr:uncharacterized protein LOC103640801 isoform X1 [Zea mays]XP_020401539.1 uncharacterized protein LOC103640801 isoform X1 [Zea mays]|eukprot:XP_020401538.1 uncharacterized protein LOC103640801 [Zea mays]